MANLPAIPQPGAPICAADIERIESHIAQQVALIEDVDVLEEWRSRAAAFEAYLRNKNMSAPMLGAQRRVEARIGQLLGEPSHVPGSLPRAGNSLSGTDRQRFRLLARALEFNLEESAWRQSRRALIGFLQAKYPVPSRQPTVVAQVEQQVESESPPTTSEPAGPGAQTRSTPIDAEPEPEGLTSDEEAEEWANFEREYAASIDKVMSADDHMAAAHEEIKRQAAEIAVLKQSRDGFMNGKGAIVKLLQAEQRKTDRLQKTVARLEGEVRRLEGENESLRERVAIMEGEC